MGLVVVIVVVVLLVVVVLVVLLVLVVLVVPLVLVVLLGPVVPHSSPLALLVPRYHPFRILPAQLSLSLPVLNQQC